mgnify:FL=1
MKRYTVTAALPYANGPLHIGHLAGAYLSSDIYVRYLRLMGRDVAYICGSDEHGAAITIRAKKEGTTPQEIVDKYNAQIKDTFEKLGVSFDMYHRTSAPIHHETSQEFFRILLEKGEFEKKTTEQYYDASANQFLADRYIKGTCPKCSYDAAFGDQCENCGSTLSPTELINPVSTITGEKPVLRETSHWYLSLDKHAEWLAEWIDNGKLNGEQHHDPKEWKNHVLGQCRSWVGDLQPRAMTRDLEWGIDVPPEVEGSEGKKLYVWLDAPIGYISATKQWAADTGKDWELYWKDKETKLVHFIGKDNIVFHCIIFPAILKATGDYILPENVPANQFMNLEGDKISTSRNWAVWAHEYVEDCAESVENHIDVLRYVLIKNMPEQKDSEFTWSNFQELNNSDLVGKFANFINRVLVLTNKYYEGAVPDFDGSISVAGSQEEGTTSTYATELKILHEKLVELTNFIEAYEFRAALKALIEISTLGNQFLQFNAPWKQIKTDENAVKVVMNLALQIVAVLSVASQPFLPFTSKKIRDLLNLKDLENGGLQEMLTTLEKGEALLSAGHKINTPSHLFTRIPDEVIEAQIDKLKNSRPQIVEYAPVKEETTFDDFSKIDLRSGTITAAEKVPKAKKLLKLTVDLGFESRTVVSGIAEFYEAENVVGQQVVVVANLAPRKLRGVMSEGMILMAENEKGELVFVRPEEGFGNGFVVR